MQGPVFANIVLADEINRTPPKTQSALLEAMQEHRVTIQGKTYELEEPFFVFATQNPIELEGTYPLPEAQLDRFMFEIIMDYLPANDELDVVRATPATQDFHLQHAMTGEQIRTYQALVRRVPVAEPVLQYALDLVRKSRPGEEAAAEFVDHWVSYGASVRAGQFLGLGGKALSQPHVAETAEALNRMQPRYLAFLALVLIPGTPLAREADAGSFIELEPRELLVEMMVV